MQNPSMTNMKKIIYTLAAAAVVSSLCVAPVIADERKDLEDLRSTTYELIKMLVDEGVLSRAKADILIREADKRVAEARKKAVETPAAGSKTVRVPYVPESVRREISEEVKQEVIAQAKAERWGNPGVLPEWLDRISFDGDIRLRYQGDMFQPDNAPAAFFQAQGQNISNTTEDRQRYRVRARLGVNMKIADWLSGGLRMTTGNTDDPVSTNQTLGNSMNKYTLVLDRAYLKADPYAWLTVAGGRIPNPFFSTDLMWDEDINFEGFAATLKPQFNDSTSGFLTMGAFPLQEVSNSLTTQARDKWLVGTQAGVEWIAPNKSRFKVGAGLYDFRNYEGTRNAPGSQLTNLTAPQFRQKGNTLFNIDNDGDPSTTLFALAPNYRILNLTGALDLARFDPVHIVLTGDYVRNVGFDQADILRRTGFSLDRQNTGYMGRVLVGMPQLRDRGDWQAIAGYRYLERDATVDAFTDSDFHLGGTNNKGFFLGGSYGLGRNNWVSFRWMSSTEISGAPLSVDVLQLDFNARF